MLTKHVSVALEALYAALEEAQIRRDATAINHATEKIQLVVGLYKGQR